MKRGGRLGGWSARGVHGLDDVRGNPRAASGRRFDDPIFDDFDPPEALDELVPEELRVGASRGFVLIDLEEMGDS